MVRFNKFMFFQVLQLMSILQKIVNLVAIVASLALLYHLNINLNAASKIEEDIIELTQLIGRGEPLSEPQVERLSSILKQETGDISNRSPLCFLRAYEQVVKKEKIAAQSIFNIFEAGKQFSGISTCKHYYSLLIYRASTSQHTEQVKIVNVLSNLLKSQMSSKDPAPICLYFYAFNSEITIKQQVSQIIAQNYRGATTFIEVDAARDNTHMFAQYTLDQNKDNLNSNHIKINQETERKGFLNQLAHTVESQCPDSSIVLLLDRSSILLSHHSFSLINQVFASPQVQVALFKSLTIKHENIESNLLSEFPNAYPVLTFRKQAFPKLKPFIAKISESSEFLEFQHEILAFRLHKEEVSSSLITYVDQAVIYRQTRSQNEQEALQNLLQKTDGL